MIPKFVYLILLSIKTVIKVVRIICAYVNECKISINKMHSKMETDTLFD